MFPQFFRAGGWMALAGTFLFPSFGTDAHTNNPCSQPLPLHPRDSDAIQIRSESIYRGLGPKMGQCPISNLTFRTAKYRYHPYSSTSSVDSSQNPYPNPNPNEYPINLRNQRKHPHPPPTPHSPPPSAPRQPTKSPPPQPPPAHPYPAAIPTIHPTPTRRRRK